MSLITGFIISAGGPLKIRPRPVTPRPNLATLIVIIADLATLKISQPLPTAAAQLELLRNMQCAVATNLHTQTYA